VKVKGHCYRNHDKQPTIEVVHLSSAKVVSSTTKTPSNTTEEPDYLAHLKSDADVGVLQLKEWFEWDDMSPSLLALFSAFDPGSASRT
jgi:hypothetical protein